MKTYKEIEQKQQEYEKKFDDLKELQSKDRKVLATCGEWIDFLGEILIWNVVEYAKKIGYDFESNDDIFEMTDEAKKELVITEEEARKQLEEIERMLKSSSNRTRNSKTFEGINLFEIDLEILKWILE